MSYKLIQKKSTISNRMQSQNYLAVIMAQGKHNDLFPLTLNYPAANLTVSNKYLIGYQLEQLESIQKLQGITIIYSPQNHKLRDYIKNRFIPANPAYPHKITFFQADDNNPEYDSFRKFLNSDQFFNMGSLKGVIMLPVDVLSSVSFGQVIQMHEDNDSDLTLFLKQKKEYSKGEKEPEIDFESAVDIALIGATNGQVLAFDSIQDVEYAGFDVGASVYNQSSRGIFYRVIDTKVYILSQNVVKIAQGLEIPDPTTVKHDFISTLIKHQTNITLLNYISKNYRKALRIFGKVAPQNEYIRTVLNLKVYEQLNLDGLIRGSKQKQILMPNKYTQPIDEKLMNQYKGCLVGSSSVMEAGCKMRRSTVGNGCRLGKNVDITNSVIMENVTIESNCKIADSIIGPNCLIRADSTLVNCQLAQGCLVEAESKRDGEVILPISD